MEVVAARCAGLDVHKATIVACALIAQEGRARPRKEYATFPTTAAGLASLAAWLKGLGVEQVGMEATGVYWRPVYAVLEAQGGFELIVANAQHIKTVPGRKTDIKDAEWLAMLVRHGLMRKSFIPDQPFRDLRDLTRYRRALVETQASERHRLIQVLESADIKLSGLVSDVFGLSGRLMLRALIAGEQDPAVLADLARGQLRKKRDALREALAARLGEHQQRMLAIQLSRVEAAEADIAVLDQEIDQRLEPYAEEMALLITIPGVDRVVAAAVVAELGTDLSSFPSAEHLAAWSGTCPGNRESAGKAKPARARKGNPHLKTALCNAAIAATRKKGSYLRAKYYKLKARIGGGKAALAIAHKLVVVIYHVLSKRVAYRDLGEDYLDQINAKRTAQRYVQKLNALGYGVSLSLLTRPAPAPQAEPL